MLQHRHFNLNHESFLCINLLPHHTTCVCLGSSAACSHTACRTHAVITVFTSQSSHGGEMDSCCSKLSTVFWRVKLHTYGCITVTACPLHTPTHTAGLCTGNLFHSWNMETPWHDVLCQSVFSHLFVMWVIWSRMPHTTNKSEVQNSGVNIESLFVLFCRRDE